ncbi:TPA: fimbrial protein [Salmonella enterica subsp. salamae serovar 30:g,m,s:e,n,x]|nr:fimbrial protein [Salmonella enterica subsp. salamae serovar 30:g,m,s:e,n,x]
MKFNPSFIALSVSALLFSGMTSATITGTSSVELSVVSKVVAGTCTAKVLNGAGTESDEIAFGDVYKSDLVNKSRVEPLKIAFTNCSGVTKATVVAQPLSGTGCSGPNSDGDSFAGGNSVGFEVWSGNVDSGVLLNCYTPPPAQPVTITEGVGEFPMNTRIVIAHGRAITDVKDGIVSAPVTFVVTYP